MAWRGRGPDPEAGNAPQFKPGTYRVRLTKIIDQDDKDGYLVVLSDHTEAECVQFVPENIDQEANPKKAWLFWRLCGAFDYPNVKYWEAAPEEREEREWYTRETLEQIIKHQAEAMIEVEAFNGKKGPMASVKDMWSPRREAEKGAPSRDSEVPF